MDCFGGRSFVDLGFGVGIRILCLALFTRTESPAPLPHPHTHIHTCWCVCCFNRNSAVHRESKAFITGLSELIADGRINDEAFRSCNGAQNVPFTTLCICLIHKTVVSHSGGSTGSWMTQAGGNGMVREAIPFFCVQSVRSSPCEFV